MIWPREDDWMIRMKVMLTDWVMQHYAIHHSWGQFHGKGPFTHSRIAPPIIPDLNLWCSGAQHHGHSLFPEDLFLQTNSVRSIEVTCEKPPSGRRCDTGGRVLPDWGHMWEVSIGKTVRYRWTCLTRLRSHVRSIHREDGAIQVDVSYPIEVTCEKHPSGRRCDTGGRVLPDWGHMWEASIGKTLRYRWTCLTRLRLMT